MKPHTRISDLLLLALAIAALGGCGSTSALERYPRGPFVGNQGHASEVLFAPTPSPEGWEYARTDDHMNIRTPDSIAFDEAHRPGLGQLRRITIQSRFDQVYYFERSRPRRSW